MTASEIYNSVVSYIGGEPTVICELHSACSSAKRKTPLCGRRRSAWPVVNFDDVKDKMYVGPGVDRPKSVDALTVSASKQKLIFVELKSWHLLLKYHGSKESVLRQADKYRKDIPEKLRSSLRICRTITTVSEAFDGCELVYAFVSDLSVSQHTNPLGAINNNLNMLASSATDMRNLCDMVSRDILAGISEAKTYYVDCVEFDNLFITL